MLDTPQVLAAHGTFENQDNLRNKMFRLSRGKRYYPHGSYAFPQHPLQITHEKRSNSIGTISKCNQTLFRHSQPGHWASHVGVRKSREGKVFLGPHKGSLKALSSSAWDKTPCSYISQRF